MTLFAFKSNTHFVTSSDGTILQVYELTKPPHQLSSIKKADWKQVATITASLEEEEDNDDEKEEAEDDNDVDKEASDDKSYNGLSFLDGHGKIEEEKAMTTLAQHLKQLRLLVNPKGYCFQDVSELGIYSDFGIRYLRLNDLFSWPRHNISLVLTGTMWSRLEFKYILPKHQGGPSKSTKPTVGGGVSKEKYAKLEMLVKEKEEELEKLKEEMEEANEANEKELQKLKKAYEDQHKQVQKKDKELRTLKKMKDEEAAKAQRIEELEKLNEDLEEANKAKDEELQKLAKSKNVGEIQRQLKKKDDELKILKKMKDEEETKTKRIEELEKLNKELEEATKAKEEELQKMKKKKPNEGANKATRVAELEKLKDEMEDVIAAKDEELERVKKEKEEEIRKVLKKKEVELRALKNKNVDETEKKSRRIEELKKTVEEMEVANVVRDEELQNLKNGKNEELQKALREKNLELRLLERKNEDEKNNAEAKARKAEGELQEAKDKLSFSVAEVAQANKELEQCQKLSWAILPVTNFLPQSADAKEKYLRTRQRFAPEKFSCDPLLDFPFVANSPKLLDNMNNWTNNEVKLVDEETTSTNTWPAPPTIMIRIGRGVQDFDRNNWWYVKTTHPEGGLTMLVYYDGNQTQLTLASSLGIVPLPCAKNIEFITFTYRMSLFDLTPLGFRLGFTYRL